MTKEYSSPSTSPLSTPRSRAVVALLDKTRSKLGRHRNGQRKISEIVQENNALISGILGLNSEESERGGAGELSVSRSASAPVDGEVVEKLQAEYGEHERGVRARHGSPYTTSLGHQHEPQDVRTAATTITLHVHA